jgi:hypothetical protein
VRAIVDDDLLTQIPMIRITLYSDKADDFIAKLEKK